MSYIFLYDDEELERARLECGKSDPTTLSSPSSALSMSYIFLYEDEELERARFGRGGNDPWKLVVTLEFDIVRSRDVLLLVAIEAKEDAGRLTLPFLFFALEHDVAESADDVTFDEIETEEDAECLNPRTPLLLFLLVVVVDAASATSPSITFST